MENKVNRILQDKINLLSKQELEALAQSYVGKYAFILFDSRFSVSKIISYETSGWFNDGLDFSDKERDRKVGDKTILFQLENKDNWELIDFAVIGDTLNVRDASGGGYTNLEITNLTDTTIGFSDGRNFIFPISRTRMITPMLMDIAWLDSKSLPQMTTQQAPAPTFTVIGVFAVTESADPVNTSPPPPPCPQ